VRNLFFLLGRIRWSKQFRIKKIKTRWDGGYCMWVGYGLEFRVHSPPTYFSRRDEDELEPLANRGLTVKSSR